MNNFPVKKLSFFVVIEKISLQKISHNIIIKYIIFSIFLVPCIVVQGPPASGKETMVLTRNTELVIAQLIL